MDRPLRAVRSEINGGMHRVSLFFREYRGGVDARRRWRDTPAARPADSIRSAPVKTERGGEEESRGGVGFDRRAREVAGDEVQRRGSPELREKGLPCLTRRGSGRIASVGHEEGFASVKSTGGQLQS